MAVSPPSRQGRTRANGGAGWAEAAAARAVALPPSGGGGGGGELGGVAAALGGGERRRGGGGVGPRQKSRPFRAGFPLCCSLPKKVHLRSLSTMGLHYSLP